MNLAENRSDRSHAHGRRQIRPVSVPSTAARSVRQLETRWTSDRSSDGRHWIVWVVVIVVRRVVGWGRGHGKPALITEVQRRLDGASQRPLGLPPLVDAHNDQPHRWQHRPLGRQLRSCARRQPLAESFNLEVKEPPSKSLEITGSLEPEVHVAHARSQSGMRPWPHGQVAGSASRSDRGVVVERPLAEATEPPADVETDDVCVVASAGDPTCGAPSRISSRPF